MPAANRDPSEPNDYRTGDLRLILFALHHVLDETLSQSERDIWTNRLLRYRIPVNDIADVDELQDLYDSVNTILIARDNRGLGNEDRDQPNPNAADAVARAQFRLIVRENTFDRAPIVERD